VHPKPFSSKSTPSPGALRQFVPKELADWLETIEQWLAAHPDYERDLGIRQGYH